MAISSPALNAAEVRSPDGRIVFSVAVDDSGAPRYRVAYSGEEVIHESRLGLHFEKQHGFEDGFAVAAVTPGDADFTWQQPWGERRLVREHYNEILVEFVAAKKPRRRFNLRVRVFNDGLGFRYEVPRQSRYRRVNIVDELTEFHIPGDATAWWIPGRRFNRYEYIYQSGALEGIEMAHTPMTLRLPSGVHISLHEAALVDYAAYVLDQRRPNLFEVNLTPWSDGIRVKTGTPFLTPWRTIQIAPDAMGLLNSSLILNLNEPNALDDVSWVQPGKYVGIWWGMHIRTYTWASGEKHGATTANTKRHMDFAAQHGFDGVLVEGWNLGWDGDWFFNGDVFSFTETYPDFDLKEVADYGRSLGVKLIGHHETSGNITNYENQWDAAYSLYEAMGVHEIKTGYVADAGDIKWVDRKGVAHYEWHDGQFMVDHYLRSVKKAAEHKISLNPHEPIKDTGLRRTYPNWMTREGVRGQEFNAWGDPPNPPEHTAIIPYTRMLSGPADFTPGIFDLTFQGMESKQRVQTTLAKQLALYVVLYSPLQMAADLPENYEKRPDAFQFIVDVPADWEQSIGVAGEIGDYVVMARQERGGSDWYLGALTDEEPRELTVPLDFLSSGKRYRAEIYRDGPAAHWWDNPYDILIEQRSVTAGDELVLPLGASGGAAIRFVPVN
ncbi:MAG: glycoside hydrolase family 97 protein [Gammaproteobacteria bacterium]|nr:glycoside hydrolase family 97 protein [Gammaproteobacteria bacterium]NNM20002.1 glycoside hydrolase family 97 protein [Gammaproteobacteria bacterium]